MKYARNVRFQLKDGKREAAQLFGKTAYPEVMRKLTPVIEGTPKMGLCEASARSFS